MLTGLPASKRGELDAVDTTTYFETRSLPRFDSCAPAHLKLGRSPLPIAALRSMSLTPVSSIRPLGLPIYACHDVASLRRRVASVPAAPLYLARARSARPLPRGVTGHVAVPNGSILAPTLRHFPCMSLIPFAPIETRSLPTLLRCYPAQL